MTVDIWVVSTTAVLTVSTNQVWIQWIQIPKLEGEELEKNLAELRNEVEELKKKTPYEHILAAGSMSAKQWKKAESQQKLG